MDMLIKRRDIKKIVRNGYSMKEIKTREYIWYEHEQILKIWIRIQSVLQLLFKKERYYDSLCTYWSDTKNNKQPLKISITLFSLHICP